MQRHILIAAMCTVLAIASGCSTPKVTYYDTIPIKCTESVIRFTLQGSKVSISIPDDDSPPQATEKPTEVKDKVKPSAAETVVKKAGLMKFKNISSVTELEKAKVTVIIDEAKKTLHYMEPKENWFYKTNLNVSFYEGTKVPKSVGVEFEDNAIKTIESMGGFVGAVLPMLIALDFQTPPPADKGIQLPIILDFTDPIAFTDDNLNKSKWLILSEKSKYWWYKFDVKPPKMLKTSTSVSDKNADGALSYSEFFGTEGEKTSRLFPFSACNEVEIIIAQTPDGKEPNDNTAYNKFIFTENLPNPTRVDFLPLPRKGNITLHENCGANITNEKTNTADTFQILEAVGKQANAIYSAIKNKNQKPADTAKAK